jgi:hypothetical protein
MDGSQHMQASNKFYCNFFWVDDYIIVLYPENHTDGSATKFILRIKYVTQVVSAAASAFFSRVVPINIPYYNYSVDRHASILEEFMTMSTYSQILINPYVRANLSL